MIFSVLFYYFWEAMLVSYLAARIVVLPFTDIQTMLALTDYKVAVIHNSYQQSVFQESMDPTWKMVWAERIEPNLEEYRDYLGVIYVTFSTFGNVKNLKTQLNSECSPLLF